MSPAARKFLFAVAAVCTLPAVARVALHMPRFGAHPTPYGDAIGVAGPAQRHVANLVSALNFDFRGFDTLGEEFILLCAVTGVTVLLRGARGEERSAKPGVVDGRPVRPPSEGVTLACRVVGVFMLIFSLYVSAHASLTPGGGFQSGVMLASGLLLLYFGEGYAGWRKLIRSEVLDAAEASGAIVYALCGFAGLGVGLPFLSNVMPLGTFGSVWSGGLMFIINIGVLLAVAGGFGVLFLEFLEETRVDPEAGR